MVAAGLLDTSGNHAEAVANMAFDMRDAAKYVVKPATEEPLQVGHKVHKWVHTCSFWNSCSLVHGTALYRPHIILCTQNPY